ncbi:unnamed protein product [Gadus morhua 'NCC']
MCICYGHAQSCPWDPVTKKLQCVCEHNTCGESCDECCPGYHQEPWQPGTITEGNTCQSVASRGGAGDRCGVSVFRDLPLLLRMWSVSLAGKAPKHADLLPLAPARRTGAQLLAPVSHPCQSLQIFTRATGERNKSGLETPGKAFPRPQSWPPARADPFPGCLSGSNQDCGFLQSKDDDFDWQQTDATHTPANSWMPSGKLPAGGAAHTPLHSPAPRVGSQ